MNRAVAAVYAITVTDEMPLSDEKKQKLFDLVPVLVAEINRLSAIANDPFIVGYIKARETWVRHD